MRRHTKYTRNMDYDDEGFYGPVIDLHGLTADEALARFVARYNAALKSGPRYEMKVIHGYGSSGAGGVLRKRLRAFLDEHPDRVTYKRGEVFTGNPGVTIVMPVRSLPTMLDKLSAEIVAFCQTPKTLEKIVGKFRRYGDPEVRRIVARLEKSGHLKNVPRGKYNRYQAV